MTTPGASAPDGAWQLGSTYGQGMTEDSVMQATTGQARASLLDAVAGYALHLGEQEATRADLIDGQNSLKSRLDLLADVSGYGSAVMGWNWQIPYSQWIALPFDTQLGPAKSVAISTPVENSGFLTLKKGGLWRVDAHCTVSGFSIGLSYFWNGSILIPYNTYSPIFPTLRIEVLDATGQVISASEYNMVSDLQLNSETLFTYTNAPRSGAFSKTFVLDHMPPETDPSAPDHWKHVRLAIRYEPIYTGTINDTTCKVLGGTKLSSLIATRWSRDANHINYADEVPDGGDLG